MTKHDDDAGDPTDKARRRIVQGGLLVAAAALGFLPSCDDSEVRAGAPGAPPAPPRPMNAGPAGSGGLNSASAQTLPRAVLGKTGVSIPIVGFGTSRLGQRGGTPNAEQYANMLEVFRGALDLGIEYFDTAAIYGRAEEALGEVLQGQRDKVFLVTKIFSDTRAEAERLFQRSLELLKTDHVDLLHLHAVGDRNLDTALAQDGSWRYIQDQKAMGKTRFAGITGHNNPANFMRMLATNEVDVVMTIMNFVDHSTYGLSKEVREEALARDCGLMAMKVFGGTESNLVPGGGFANATAAEPHPSNMQVSFDQSVLPDCMRFVKALGGVTGMVIGINDLAELAQNIRWAIDAQPFSPTEMDAIIRMGQTVAPSWARRYG